MKFFYGKSNSHIFLKDGIVGRFSNGVFETDKPDIIEALKKVYEYEGDKKVVADKPKEVKEVVEEVVEDKQVDEWTPEKLRALKMPQLVKLANETGEGIFQVGMKKVELVEALYAELTK